jgi:serine/threonine protein kinase
VKRVCTYCGKISADGNLWCQEKECPAGANSVVLSYGEFLGDIEIVRLVSVINTASIYEARRGQVKLLLKVAHDGCQEQLKREATTLSQLASQQHPMLPILLSPYLHAEVKQRPYGKTVFRDETKYYEVFEYVEGEFLRDMLLKNPQPWYQHAAWLVISIADAIAFLHVKGKKLHLNISPDVIYVRTDRDGIPRPLLLDLGVVGDTTSVDLTWLYRYGLPGYTAPEVIDRSTPPSFASDVYGLGLVLYETLAGHPAFGKKTDQDEDVRREVVRSTPPVLNRSDLAEDIVATVMQAIDKAPTRRQPDVRTFAKALRSKFGEVPVERKRRAINRKVAAAVVFAVLVFVALLLLASFLPG